MFVIFLFICYQIFSWLICYIEYFCFVRWCFYTAFCHFFFNFLHLNVCIGSRNVTFLQTIFQNLDFYERDYKVGRYSAIRSPFIPISIVIICYILGRNCLLILKMFLEIGKYLFDYITFFNTFIYGNSNIFASVTGSRKIT